jgi:hypothetical protein
MSLGATTLPRAQFLQQLPRVIAAPAPDWTLIRQQRYDIVQLLDEHLFLL